MKRSGSESRWADIPSTRTRFAAEAAFLILVAAGAALARLSPLAIIGLMLIAWLLVALIERASSREQSRALAGAEETELLPMPVTEPAEAPPAEDDERRPQVSPRWLFWRREAGEPLRLPRSHSKSVPRARMSGRSRLNRRLRRSSSRRRSPRSS